MSTVFLLALACRPAVEPVPAAAAPPPIEAVHGAPAERVAFFRTALEEDAADSELDALSRELVGWLGDPDPAVRDGLAYELLARWIRDRLSPESLRSLIGLLYARLDADEGSEPVLGRSFSALVLSAVALRERDAPFLTDGELADMVTRAAAYAERETDLRGRDEALGWIHAGAHTADWLRALAMHPRLSPEQSATILRAVLSVAVRPHGFVLHDGEDGRLAQPVLELLRHDRIGSAEFTPWVQELGAPLAKPFPGAFEPVLYAQQRNARNLLFTLFVALSVEEEPNLAATSALAAIRSRIAR